LLGLGEFVEPLATSVVRPLGAPVVLECESPGVPEGDSAVVDVEGRRVSSVIRRSVE
jgi:hypothetical protein